MQGHAGGHLRRVQSVAPPPTEAFATAEAWEAWLERHQAEPEGIWLKIAKAGAATKTVTYQQALDVALSYGWIDGQKRPLDADYWLQRFVPRQPRSKWSKINRQKAEELTALGRMKPAGFREIERAKADGRWEAAYDSPRSACIPEDLQSELDANPEAQAFFALLDSANRYAILYRLQDAKRPDTRAQRLQKFVGMLNAHQKLHP